MTRDTVARDADEVERDDVAGTEPTYTVGRGKPPAHTQFKPGQSGNPRGRPRGSVDFGRALLAAASESVVITENGRKVRLSKFEVAARQVANKAAAGDPRAVELLYKHLGSMVAVEPVAAPSSDQADLSFGSEEDTQVLEAFVQRLKKEGSS